MAEAEGMASKIASFDPVSVQATKEAAVRGLDLSLADGLRLEYQLSAHVQSARQKKK